MPVGRFRKDPRDLNELEKRVYSAQYPEGALVVGMGVGMAVPLLARQATITGVVIDLLASPVSPAVGAILFGIVAYLLGHAFKQQRVRTLKRSSGGDLGHTARATGSAERDRGE